MPLRKDELMEYPYFFNKKLNSLKLKQNKTGVPSKPKRALSIVPNHHEKEGTATVASMVRSKEVHGLTIPVSVMTSPSRGRDTSNDRPLSAKSAVKRTSARQENASFSQRVTS